MTWHLPLWHWLAHSALGGALLLSLGALAGAGRGGLIQAGP